MKKNNKIIRDYVLRLLEKKKSISKNIKRNIENFRYLDLGQIDSLELITFISSIEKKFQFKFTSKELASDQFRIFSGLLRFIEKRSRL